MVVIGVVSAVGTDAGMVLDCIRDNLAKFDYSMRDIKVSELVLSPFADGRELATEYDRISYYMDLGDRIRRDSGDSGILMAGVAAFIHSELRQGHQAQLSRTAFVINSIKHPDEVHFLRETYGSAFHLLGVTDSRENRLRYLIRRKGMDEDQATSLLARDENESDRRGQHTRDVFQESDYFIKAGDDRKSIEGDISRLIDLLFGNPFITPTFAEYAMFRAYVASLRSADLSRQVGAVVVRGDEVLAEGANDCPKAGGGLYWPFRGGDGAYRDSEGGRDYTLGFDSNKHQQREMISRVLGEFGLPANDENVGKARRAGIGSLTEYGRVVHAEMEALSMCARNGIATRGGEMYVTTFPCHNCAKHIIAAGISRVVYIEPYPKSKAYDFYRNEIAGPDASEEGKVSFVPFFGIGPHRLEDLFSMRSIRWRERQRKTSGGEIVEWSGKESGLRNPISPMGYLAVEEIAYMDYYEKVSGLREGTPHEH